MTFFFSSFSIHRVPAGTWASALAQFNRSNMIWMIYITFLHCPEGSSRSCLLIFYRLVLFPVLTMNSDPPTHSHFQRTPGENHSTNFFCQFSASHHVGRSFFGYVSLDDLFYLYPDSLLSNGPALGILSTPRHGPTYLRRPPLSITLSHRSLLP